MSANIINVPDRALSWRWLDESEENRLTFFPDSKKPNAGTFVLSKEDHTLGNLIRLQLLRDTSVRFAGYRMPHPLIFDCHVRVETMDSKLTPMNVFDAALSDLQLETEALITKWEVCKKSNWNPRDFHTPYMPRLTYQSMSISELIVDTQTIFVYKCISRLLLTSLRLTKACQDRTTSEGAASYCSLFLYLWESIGYG